MEPEHPRSETDKSISELARGAPERAALGNNPMGSILRIILFVVLFIVIAGTLFYFARG